MSSHSRDSEQHSRNRSAFMEPNCNRVRITYLSNILSDRLRSHSRSEKPPRIDLQPGDMRYYAESVIQNPRFRNDVSHMADLLSVALAPSEWPSPGIPALRTAAGPAASSGVCGRVWKKDELAYKCKTCERDPTCVVCVPCFKMGNHEGHDYAMVRTGGGCCDCGDVQAWKLNGFCSEHRGAFAEDEDPSAALPPALRQNLLQAVEVVATEVLTQCLGLSATKESVPDAKERVAGLLHWLTEVVQCGDGIRRAVGVFLAAPFMSWVGGKARGYEGEPVPTFHCDEAEAPKFSWLSMMLEIDGVNRLPVTTQSSVHGLYFQLITDLVFKRAFLEGFVSNYERYIHAQVVHIMNMEPRERHTDTDIVENFTVQLFTVPALVPVMAKKGGLLDILLDLLQNLFETIAQPVTSYAKAVPFAESEFARKYLHGLKSEDVDAASAGKASSSMSRPLKRMRRPRLPVPFSTDGRPRSQVRLSSALHPDRAVRKLHESLRTHGLPRDVIRNNPPNITPGPNLLPGTAEELSMAEEAAERWAPNPANGNGFVEVNVVPNFGEIDQPVITMDGDEFTVEFQDHGFNVEVDEDDFEDEDERHGRRQHDAIYASRLKEQLIMFEAGLHFVPKERATIPAEVLMSSTYIEAVCEARQMEQDALNGNGPLAHTMRLDWFHAQENVGDWICVRVISDLKYILNHLAGAHEVVHARKDLFRKFVRIMSMAQGMNHLARRFGDPVRIEIDSWNRSFPFELEFYYCVELMAQTFCSQTVNSHVTSSQTALDNQPIDFAASRLNCMRIVKTCLDEWIDREEALEARSIYAGEVFSVAHSVSVHLPLHRFYAFMLHHIIRLDGVDLPRLFSSDCPYASDQSVSEDARRIMQHPLRLQCFLAQVRAGMWRRNGRPVVGQATFYRSLFRSEWFIDLDLFIQQCCAVLVGPSVFLSEIQQAYRFDNFAKVLSFCGTQQAKNIHGFPSASVNMTTVHGSELVPSGGEARRDNTRSYGAADRQISSAKSIGLLPLAPRLEDAGNKFATGSVPGLGNTYSDVLGYLPTLVEDFMIHVVRVASERTRCGSTEADLLRSKLLHQLCSKDRTHSQLYRTCSFRVCNEIDKNNSYGNTVRDGDKSDCLVESTLHAIAEFIEPKGMEQGKYKLKDEIWREFNPFSPHLSPRDRCAAEVRHGVACKRESRALQSIPTASVLDKKIFTQFANLENIFVAVSEENGIATELLKRVLPLGGGPQGLEGGVSAALHLVCTAVEMGKKWPREENWLERASKQKLLSRSALGPICEMYTLTTSERVDVYSEFKPVFQRILKQVWDSKSGILQDYVSRNVPPHILEVLGGSGGRLNHLAEVRDSGDAEQRKVRLQKKKEQQAAVMAQMRQAQASFAEHIDTPGSAKSSGAVLPFTEKATGSPKIPVGDVDSVDNKNVESIPMEIEVSSEDDSDEDAEECALCHDASSTDASRFLGLIGFHQSTRLPPIAKARSATPVMPETVDGFAELNCRRGVGGSFCPIAYCPCTRQGPADPRVSRGLTGRSGGINGDVDVHQGAEVLRESYLFNSQMIHRGAEETSNLHIAFCGHAIHIHCFDRYFSSLMQSRANHRIYEGYNVINLERMEFLCPVCRRLANMVLPLMHNVTSRASNQVDARKSLSTVGSTFVHWIASASDDIDTKYNRLLSKAEVPSNTVLGTGIGQANGELVNTVNKLKLSIINRGKAVLHKFGLQSFRATLKAGASFDESTGEQVSYSETYARLPAAAISTVACAEIASRSRSLGGSTSHLARKSLRTVLREARAQICLEPKPRIEELRALWRIAMSNTHRRTCDPFVVISYLFFLWSSPLALFEAKNLVRLGLTMVVNQDYNKQFEVEMAEQCLLLSILLYLRRTTILVSSLFDMHPVLPLVQYSAAGTDASNEDVKQEIELLLKYFDIPCCFKDIFNKVRLDTVVGPSTQPAVTFRPRRVGLVKLPIFFQSLLEDLDGKSCCNCGRQPSSPAICLVCGVYLCSVANKCSSGGFENHAERCGAGIGVFLVIKHIHVHILRTDRSSVWGSPYLDEYGEEDEDFSRGKVLYLNVGRYASLEALWLTHGFDQDSRLLSVTMRTRQDNMRRRI